MRGKIYQNIKLGGTGGKKRLGTAGTEYNFGKRKCKIIKKKSSDFTRL